MAKSLRSKWKRKCRAVKRVRYGEKELARLKKTLGTDAEKTKDETMVEVSEIATVVDAQTLKQKKGNKKNVEIMETDEKKRIFNPKTMKDQNGTYPVWMHQRKIKKTKNIAKKTKKKENTKKTR